MRSSRVSIKARPSAPYSKLHDTRAITPGFYSREARSRRRGASSAFSAPSSSFFNTVLKSVGLGGRSDLPPLQPGDVVRDMPFFTQNSEVNYFSTHPSLCDDIFGFAPREQLYIGGGSMAGRVATVVGARGGMLWICLHGEGVARVLPTPTEGCGATPSEVRASFDHVYDIGPIVMPFADGAAPSSSSTLHTPRSSRGSGGSLRATLHSRRTMMRDQVLGTTQERASLALTMDDDFTALVTRAEEEAARLFSSEQRAFLQRALDLYVRVLSDEAAESIALHGHSIAMEMEQQSVNNNNSADSLGHGESGQSGEENGKGGEHGNSAHGESSLYRAVTAQAIEGRGITPASSMVLMSPRLLVGSGALGWAGEGTVAASGGGLKYFVASLSASVVV